MKEYKSGTYILHKGYKLFVPSFINEDIDWNFRRKNRFQQKSFLCFWRLYQNFQVINNQNLQIFCKYNKRATVVALFTKKIPWMRLSYSLAFNGSTDFLFRSDASSKESSFALSSLMLERSRRSHLVPKQIKKDEVNPSFFIYPGCDSNAWPTA